MKRLSLQSVVHKVHLPVSVDVIAADSPVPRSVFNGIWSKASGLVHSGGAMAAAPGHASQERTFRSSSKTVFHLATPGRGGKFSCDCANHNSLGVCSLSVAVAEVKTLTLRGMVFQM